MNHPSCMLGVVSALLVSTSAMAAGDAAAGLQAMKERNVIVFGDMHAGHDVEGKTFVGGNLAGHGTYGIGNSGQGAAPSALPTLTVVGNASVGNVNNGPNGGAGPISSIPSVVIGGNATNLNVNAEVGNIQVGGDIIGAFNNKDRKGFTIQVGGSVPGPINAGGADMLYNQGASFADPLRAGLAGEAATLRANLTALSAALGDLAPTAGSGIDYSDPNNVRMTAVAGDAGFAVVHADAADFFTITRGLTYDFTPGLTTVVNITGTDSHSWNFNTLSGSAYNPYLLFNFVDATHITFDRMVHGSILAPYAHVQGPNTPIEGTLVAGSFHQRGENHLGTFAGDIGLGIPGVPEPSTWAMLIAGFGLVGFSMRRKQHISRQFA